MQNKTAPIETQPHVIIVGGGFGGTHAADALRNAPVRVTVIDRTNHSVFHPLLYQVATAALSSDEIAAPIRSLLRRQQNAEVVMAEVTDVDVERRVVRIGAHELVYDYLVLATGSQYNYFGHEEWARALHSLLLGLIRFDAATGNLPVVATTRVLDLLEQQDSVIPDDRALIAGAMRHPTSPITIRLPLGVNHPQFEDRCLHACRKHAVRETDVRLVPREYVRFSDTSTHPVQGGPVADIQTRSEGD